MRPDRQTLIDLLDLQSPQELLEDGSLVLDEEARAFLQARCNFDQEMDLFSETVSAQLPAPPPFDKSKIVGGPQRWWQRKLIIPVWVAPLAAVFLVFIGVSSFLLPSGVKDQDQPDLNELLSYRRSHTPGNDTTLSRLNDQLFEALLDRAIHLIDQDQKQLSQQALTDLEQALRIQPENQRCLQYLILVCEALELNERAETYRRYLETLAEESP
jgi:hypothetical protein